MAALEAHSPIGGTPLPAISERVARELVPVYKKDPAKVAAVLAKAGPLPTAEAVRAIVKPATKKPKAKKPKAIFTKADARRESKRDEGRYAVISSLEEVAKLGEVSDDDLAATVSSFSPSTRTQYAKCVMDARLQIDRLSGALTKSEAAPKRALARPKPKLRVESHPTARPKATKTGAKAA